MRETLTDDPALALIRVLVEEPAPHTPGELRPPAPGIDPQLGLALYEQMLRIRRIDERLLAKQRQGRVGFYGPITGQEATPISTALAISPDDWVFPALRESAIMLVRGFPLARWLAQVYGHREDAQKGRQMPSHQAARAVHQVSWSSCIGPQLPQAVGAAMAMKKARASTIAIAFLGDGATSQPDFHAAMTFASRYQAPVVLICQNNHWSISVPTARQTASATLAIKARAYRMRCARVDGNDALAVHQVVRDAAARARSGQGPTFIESLTYRIGPHSSSDDPSRYRSEEEVESWRRRDPILRLERALRAASILDDDRAQSIEARLRAELDAALAEVETGSPPDPDDLFEDVYAQPPPHLIEQREVLGRLAELKR